MRHRVRRPLRRLRRPLHAPLDPAGGQADRLPRQPGDARSADAGGGAHLLPVEPLIPEGRQRLEVRGEAQAGLPARRGGGRRLLHDRRLRGRRGWLRGHRPGGEAQHLQLRQRGHVRAHGAWDEGDHRPGLRGAHLGPGHSQAGVRGPGARHARRAHADPPVPLAAAGRPALLDALLGGRAQLVQPARVRALRRRPVDRRDRLRRRLRLRRGARVLRHAGRRRRSGAQRRAGRGRRDRRGQRA